MDNFTLHEQAQQLADTRSAYSLARELLDSKAEARKYKLAGLGMAVSMGEHICVPEGWQIVPVKPTDHMTWVGQSMRYHSEISIGSIYCAMLAAAPKPGEL